MKVERIVVGTYETNTYIISDNKTKDTFIIDPGMSNRQIKNYIEKNRLNLLGIILTHCHWDHVGGVEEIKNIYECDVYAHKKEINPLKDHKYNQSKNVARKQMGINVDKGLVDGDKLKFGKHELKVIHTPGHTQGGICLFAENENIIFTGDTIFEDDLGRTDLLGGSEEQLKKSIQNKVSKWADDITIYPGHGRIAKMKDVRKRKVNYLR